jgi:cyclophilin family peptidyl-prolyl cis-trans isomerase
MKDHLRLFFVMAFCFVALAAAVYNLKYWGDKRVQPVSSLPSNQSESGHLVIIKTNFGEIQFKTYDADAPKTVKNFLALAEKGFYNGLTFHRVIKGFMIQGGDPNCLPSRSSGPCGTGGPGYKFEDELDPNTKSYQEGYKRGVVAMANAGPNTNGSQFFIMHQDYPLSPNYTIFGKVIKGQEVVDKIAEVKTDQNDRPLEPVTIESVRAADLEN